MKLITAPTVEPLLLTDVKTRLSIGDNIDNIDIEAYIKAAREQAESYMQKSIITQTWEIALDYLPTKIVLLNGPVQSITSVKYYDVDDVEQTIAGTNYTLNTYTDPMELNRIKDYDWPDTNGFTNNVKIQYVTGWGDDGAAVPEDIKTAMLLVIGHWIRFQAVAESGVGPTRLPKQFYDLLCRHRVFKL